MATANKMVQEIAFLPEIKTGPEAVRSIKKFVEEIAGQISDTVKKIGEVGFTDKDLKRVANKMRKLRNEIGDARAKGNKEQEESLKAQFDIERKGLEGIIKRRKQARTALDKGGLVGLEKPAAIGVAVGEEMGQSLNDALAGELGSAGGLFKRWGGHFKKAGAAAQAKETETTTGKIRANLGGMVSQLGGIIAAVGAIAMAFAGVVKVLIDSDTRVKELNRSLIDSGAMAGDITDNIGRLESEFLKITKMAQQSEFNKVWDTLAEDQMKILGAFSQAGFTLKEMRTDIKDAKTEMQAYQMAASAALTYSKLLGESADKVAGDMADRMEDLGLSLKGVREGFANIYEAAQLSGFGTKRFFNMVLQATSGLSMYNVRMEEAAGLLLNLSNVLGTKMADKYIQGATKGFSDKSQEDRIKDAMLIGPNEVRKVIAKDISATSQTWVKLASDTFGKNFKEGAQVFEALGIDLGVSQDLLRKMSKGGPAAQKARESLAKRVGDQLQQMNPEQITKVLGDMKRAGADPKLIREFQDLTDLTQGMSGDINDLAAAMAVVGPGGKIMLDQLKASRVIGKSLANIEKMDYITISKMTGWNSEEIRVNKRIAQEREGSFNHMQKELAALNASGKKASKAQNKLWAKNHKMIIKDGKIYHAQIKKGNIEQGTQIKDLTDAFMGLGSTIGDMPKKLTLQEKMAKKVAENTLTISKRIQQHIEEFLRDIRDAVMKLANWFTGGQNEEERRAKFKAVTALQKRQQELRAKRAGATTPEEKAKLDRQIQYMDLLIRNAQKDEAGAFVGSWDEREYMRRAPQRTLDLLSKIERRERAAKKVEAAMKLGKAPSMAIAAEASAGFTPADVKSLREMISRVTEKGTVEKISRELDAKYKKKIAEELAKEAEKIKARGGTVTQDLLNKTAARISGNLAEDRRREEAGRLGKLIGEKERAELVALGEGVAASSQAAENRRAAATLQAMLEGKAPGAGGKGKAGTNIEKLEFKFEGAGPEQQKAAEDTIRVIEKKG